jgi:crossover junction endodeoxyribonuclease RuvC
MGDAAVIAFETVVGLDLSLTSTGIAITKPGDPNVWTATIKSAGKTDATWQQRHKRITTLALNILPVIPECALVVLEAPSYASTTGHQHDRSGLWWIAYDLLAGTTRTVIPVPPTVRAKYAAGKGNAGKDAVLAAVVRRYPDLDINGNDEADALTLAAIGCRLIGEPIDDPMPVANLAALDKLSLPEATHAA